MRNKICEIFCFLFYLQVRFCRATVPEEIATPPPALEIEEAAPPTFTIGVPAPPAFIIGEAAPPERSIIPT